MLVCWCVPVKTYIENSWGCGGEKCLKYSPQLMGMKNETKSGNPCARAGGNKINPAESSDTFLFHIWMDGRNTTTVLLLTHSINIKQGNKALREQTYVYAHAANKPCAHRGHLLALSLNNAITRSHLVQHAATERSLFVHPSMDGVWNANNSCNSPYSYLHFGWIAFIFLCHLRS